MTEPLTIPRYERASWRHQPVRPRKTDAYRFSLALTLIFFVTTLDVTNYLDRGNALRYLILLVPVIALLGIRAHLRSSIILKQSFSDRALLALMLVGLAGSVYALVFRNVNAAAFPIFVPMFLGLLYLGVLDHPTEEEARRLLRTIAWISALYIALNALANSGAIPALAVNRQFKNADVMYVFLGLAAAVNLKLWKRFAVLAVLAVYIFITYPSATMAVMGLAVLVAIFVTRPRASNARPYLVAIAAMIAIVIALFNFSESVKLSQDYFLAVGKKNNNNARLALWQGAIAQWKRSPVYGVVFAGETNETVVRRGGQGQPFKAAFHNDYILFLALGGVLGLGLLLLFFGSTAFTILQRHRGFVEAGEPQKAALLRTLFVGFVAWCTAAAFNPEFNGASRSATLFATYGLMMVLGKPHRRPEPTE